MAFMGCEDEPAIEGDYVKILGVTPGALLDGVEQQCTVTVEYYSLHEEQCRLAVMFNTGEYPDVNIYKVYGSIDVTAQGSGTHTFTVAVTPKDWTPNGEFQVNVILDKATKGSSWTPSGTVWASDSKTLPFSDDYWTITWELNGGTEAYQSKYPARITKGAVLAQPSPDPTKETGRYIFLGWHTDSALTQPYNFAASVTADLTLYAKWREATVADLYGAWTRTNTAGTYTLTISNNTVRLEGSQGSYVQYSNASLSPSVVQSAYLFNISGTKTGSDNNISLNYVILQDNGQSVFLYAIPLSLPQVYYKQE
jgi:uncharacterized repeat protein (TIGR02543 family)